MKVDIPLLFDWKDVDFEKPNSSSLLINPSGVYFDPTSVKLPTPSSSNIHLLCARILDVPTK